MAAAVEVLTGVAGRQRCRRRYPPSKPSRNPDSVASAPTASHLGAGLTWAGVAHRRPRAAEFFAGIGLVRLALAAAGVEVAFANDVEPTKQALYAANFGT